MKTIAEIVSFVEKSEPLTIAIAGITDEEIRLAKTAYEKNIAKFIFIDNKENILQLIKNNNVQHIFNEDNIYHTDDVHKAPAIAVELVKDGKADLPMKGQVHTSTFIKAILHKEKGIESVRRISQMTLFDGYNDELQMLTDCAINIKPDLNEKITIIENAVDVYKNFSDEEPFVALLAAVETVNPNMPDTLDSAVLTQMNRRGQINNCVIDGPLSLDNAISEKYAKLKNIESPVAGKAQILVSSYIQEANSLSKGIIHYANKPTASIIGGLKIPIIMTSRTDKQENKINTIAVSCYIMNKNK